MPGAPPGRSGARKSSAGVAQNLRRCSTTARCARKRCRAVRLATGSLTTAPRRARADAGTRPASKPAAPARAHAARNLIRCATSGVATRLRTHDVRAAARCALLTSDSHAQQCGADDRWRRCRRDRAATDTAPCKRSQQRVGRGSCSTSECRVAWIGAVIASLLPSHGSGSDVGSDCSSVGACCSSIVGARPATEPATRALAQGKQAPRPCFPRIRRPPGICPEIHIRT